MSGHIDIPCFNIGFLDSGIGGLSILAEVANTYPEQNLKYLADQKFFPYGNKQTDFLLSRLKVIAPEFVKQHDLNILIIACNTASTIALAILRRILKIPVIGVVPAIKPAAEQSIVKRIGILATPATIQSHYTKNLIKKHATHCKTYLIGNSQLVDFAELKALGQPIDISPINEILQPLHKQQVDTVVLACTHFPFLRTELANNLPSPVKLIDSAKGVSRQVGRILKCLPIENQKKSVKSHLISTADHISSSKLRKAYNNYISLLAPNY
ncbi:MAG: glutamate racemase [Oligoflexales bacterium]